MPPRAIELAKRTLVSLLRSLGREYGVPLTVTRDSADTAVNAAYRVGEKVSKSAQESPTDFFSLLARGASLLRGLLPVHS